MLILLLYIVFSDVFLSSMNRLKLSRKVDSETLSEAVTIEDSDDDVEISSYVLCCFNCQVFISLHFL